ncbi:15-hydroxyprostaglandin dehydrogenase [NAD(+)]-like isoform X2 [Fopius arisanus]|uniref:15-hydroxyprostaglandin dehydrogenase [NAD(+)]-like isoform X2 n=1 Tax=Fopius arisanus TaxID=64838 RepID=A0A9R1U097_9HYME|nr:PREDICTED: 15-hydroxyprostaglandin dehydrogenase [NAD(+)]-like isoform X2 [Fopius arisanus]
MSLRCFLRPIILQFDRSLPQLAHRAEFATALNEHKPDGKKRKKGIWPWSKEPEEEKIKILKPGECKPEESFLDPKCKVAIIVDAGKSLGLSAAHSLLHHGAKNVIMAGDNPSVGTRAAQQLCDTHGKDRAQFAMCALNTVCKFEVSPSCAGHNGDDANWSNTRRVIEAGMKFMGKHNGGAGGIIINTTRIIGFMGWPEEPIPVYTSKEPVVETTQDLAEMFPFEKTGVRIITLLEASRPFEEIGLPDFPPPETKREKGKRMYTSGASALESKIGRAIVHLMAKAMNGSVWLIESASPLQLPRLIHFPKKGEKVDGRIYDRVRCPPAFESFCASAKNSKCSPDTRTDCPGKTNK